MREVLSWSSNDAARALTGMARIDSVNRHMLQHGMTRSLLVWWGPEQVNIGIVEVRDAGYAFAIAVLTQYNADHAAARAFVAAVGSTTLDFFDGHVYADGR